MVARRARRTKRLRVVVTCSHRKSTEVPDALRLRVLNHLTPSARTKTWVRRLSHNSTPTISAVELYAGEHWEVARHLCDSDAGGIPVELWVCSAGYGLIPAAAELLPYSATFSADSPDTIPDGNAGAARWWAALQSWDGPAAAPRSLAALVEDDPSSRVIVALSAPYVQACRLDLVNAAATARPGQFSVVSAGTKRDADLTPYLLPVDARLQHVVGGTRQALNVRAVSHLLTAGATSHADMEASLTALLAEQPPVPRYERRRASDAEVRTFIRRRLRADNTATHSRLLREFRNSDRACEQSRFADLFRAELSEAR